VSAELPAVAIEDLISRAVIFEDHRVGGASFVQEQSCLIEENALAIFADDAGAAAITVLLDSRRADERSIRDRARLSADFRLRRSRPDDFLAALDPGTYLARGLARN